MDVGSIPLVFSVQDLFSYVIIASRRARDIHHFVAQVEELFSSEGLGEEIGYVLIGGYKGNANFAFFDTFSNEEVSTLNVFNTSMVFWIIGEVDRRLVVDL